MKKPAIKKVLVVYYSHNYGALDKVRKALDTYNASYRVIDREKLNKSHIKNKDIILTVGGDGTFLKTAQFVDETPMLGICSNMKLNEGFFTRACSPDVNQKIKALLEGNHKIIKLTRLEATINKRTKLPLALNEIFIGDREPYHTARYTIQVGRKKEYQKSSGVIISTASGSSAWAKSAGGASLPLLSKKYQYVVREPYSGRLTKPRLLKGILNPKQTLRIHSHIYEGIAVVDSQAKEHFLSEHDTIEIKVSRKPLNLIEF